MSKQQNYVVMLTSGRVRTYEKAGSVMEILTDIYQEYQTAGSQWDRPDKLFLNGKAIVPSSLASLAWDFGQWYYDELEQARSRAATWVHGHLKALEATA